MAPHNSTRTTGNSWQVMVLPSTESRQSTAQLLAGLSTICQCVACLPAHVFALPPTCLLAIVLPTHPTPLLSCLLPVSLAAGSSLLWTWFLVQPWVTCASRSRATLSTASSPSLLDRRRHLQQQVRGHTQQHTHIRSSRSSSSRAGETATPLPAMATLSTCCSLGLWLLLQHGCGTVVAAGGS